MKPQTLEILEMNIPICRDAPSGRLYLVLRLFVPFLPKSPNRKTLILAIPPKPTHLHPTWLYQLHLHA